MIKELHLQDPATAVDVWRLQHAAYAVEAQLIRFDAIPPLMDTIQTLRQCGQTFFGIRSDEQLVAAMACERSGDTVTICRMMVHPGHFRRGYARRLLAYVENHYSDAERFIVSTGSKNEPAVRLYLSIGYSIWKEWEAAPGLMLTKFVKSAAKEGLQ